MQQVAYKAYGDVASRTAGDRQVELSLFKQVTEALSAVSSDASYASKIEAVSRNLELWSALATDLLHPDNALPDELKASLLSLSEFTRRTGMSFLTGGEVNIDDFVEINNSVISGLA